MCTRAAVVDREPRDFSECEQYGRTDPVEPHSSPTMSFSSRPRLMVVSNKPPSPIPIFATSTSYPNDATFSISSPNHSLLRSTDPTISNKPFYCSCLEGKKRISRMARTSEVTLMFSWLVILPRPNRKCFVSCSTRRLWLLQRRVEVVRVSVLQPRSLPTRTLVRSLHLPQATR